MTTLHQLNRIRLKELNSTFKPFVSNLVDGRKYKESSITIKKYRSDKVLDRLNNLSKQEK